MASLVVRIMRGLCRCRLYRPTPVTVSRLVRIWSAAFRCSAERPASVSHQRSALTSGLNFLCPSLCELQHRHFVIEHGLRRDHDLAVMLHRNRLRVLCYIGNIFGPDRANGISQRFGFEAFFGDGRGVLE